MDFGWGSDMNLHKYNSYLPNVTGQETTTIGRRGLQETTPERLFNSPSFVGTNAPGLPAVRRPRAGTMPSRTTVLPYTTSLTATTTTTTTTDNSVSSSTVTTPSVTSGDMYLDSGSSLNLAAPSSDIGRRRSGSVTILSSSDSNTPRQDYGKTMFTSGFPPYYMMEENASDTVQRTLASLGLEDTHNATPTPLASYVPSSAPPQPGNQKQHQPQRHRAYTVSTRHPSSSGDRLGDMLPPMGFSPFSPQTRSNVMQRPRAISLGMADNTPLDDDRLSLFSPFGMGSTSDMSTTHQHGHQQPSPLSQQISLDTQRSLRMSRSSGNMMDLTSERYWTTTANRFDSMGNYDNGSMDDLIHHDDHHAATSVSSISSAFLDSPSSTVDQTPSRALWLGNINPSLSVNDLMQQFSAYGHVESARILSDKECAFVNFTTVEAAVAAKNDLETRLDSKLGGTVVRIGFGKADVTLAMALTNEAGPNAQGPTRALWVGNIPSNINLAILQAIFQAFGPIESVRVLSHKNCGFINFIHQEDAVRARKNLQNKEILGPGSGTVRIGFAKAPSAEDINNGEPGFVSVPPQQHVMQQEHQQVIPSIQYQMYQQQHQQQLPLLSHQYHNLPQQQRYHQYITPTKEQPRHDIPATSTLTNEQHISDDSHSDSLSTNAYQATQWATAMMMTTLMMNASGRDSAAQPNLHSAISAERQFIMQQLCPSTNTTPLQQDRGPISYRSAIPPVPELGNDRTLEPLRLRDMRKRLENGQGLQDVEIIAHECMNEIVELCSDYIGNTVIQKLFEYCMESTKQAMLERIAPYLAAIAVHKNGTWAAQKIIDYANTPAQIETIQRHVAQYVPLMLLDQFGNYFAQCCLRKGAIYNQYIFDAIVDKTWEIGQGRFGARAVRSILENAVVNKDQQIYCAAAIVQNAVLLTTNANGALLLMWLLDTSEFSGRYRVLYPRLRPYLNKLCCHKLGSMTVFKIIQQQEDPDTSRLLLDALTSDTQLVDTVLRDQIHGLALMQKLVGLPHINTDQNQRMDLTQRIRASLDRLGAQQLQGYRKLIEELDVIPVVNDSLPQKSHDTPPTGQHSDITSSLTTPSGSANEQTPKNAVSWMKDPQAVAMMANMYAAAMTAAATSQQQTAPTANVPDLPAFNHILKSLLSPATESASNDPDTPATNNSE